jgi:phosphatidylglycerophosphate synthase
MVPWVPKWIETYHLTLMTIPFGLVVVGSGYLARTHDLWLLPISVMVFFQYVTDILDGAVGRYRKTGLVLWGFYMDHMMDYLFTGSIVAAYTIAYQLPSEFFLVAFTVMSGFFVHEFLMCNASGVLNTSGVYGFGPTELRLSVIVGNLLVPFMPKGLIVELLRILLPVSAVIFGWIVIRGQRRLWRIDMKQKSVLEKKR